MRLAFAVAFVGLTAFAPQTYAAPCLIMTIAETQRANAGSRGQVLVAKDLANIRIPANSK